MKPRTKIQKQVFEISSQLPALTEKQITWAKKNTVEHPGFRTKKGIICTECGQLFSDLMGFEDGETDICPHCGHHIKIESSRKRTDREIEYFCIVTVRKGWQVIRYFYIEKKCKFGKQAHYFINEVLQQWMKPGNMLVTIARPRLAYSYRLNDMWSHSGDLEIRNYSDDYNVAVNGTYPIARFLPDWKKYGFTKVIQGISLFSLFLQLQYNSKAETLLKAKQYDLLRHAVGYGSYKVHNEWASIKICMRNKYPVKDASMWFDYLDLLKRYHKDLHNAYYVCPKDLHKSHDYYMEKKRKEDAKAERERNEKRMLELKKHEQEFIKQKSKFFDLSIADGKLVIVVLKSLEEFKQEGDIMHHCIFSNSYFQKKDSLILSARIGEKRIETIEVSLRTLEVVQSRGVCNKTTEYHNRIIGLVKKNIDLIRQKIAS